MERVPWFQWPIIFTVIASVAAVHLFLTARRRYSVGRSVLLGVAGAVVMLVPLIPLRSGLYARCGDTGPYDEFDTTALLAAAVVTIIAFGALWWLYVKAGLEPMAAQRPPAMLFLGLLAMPFEYFISMSSIYEYCNGDKSWLYGQGLAAVTIAFTASLVVWRRSSR